MKRRYHDEVDRQMEKTATLNVRVSPEIKREAEEVLAQLGVSMSSAIDMFLRQISLTGGIPFPVTLPREGRAGALSGGESDQASGAAVASSVVRISSKEEALRAIRLVAAQFPAIEEAYLFGSFARGAQRDTSDVDVRIVLDETCHFTLRDLAQFAKRLEQETGREVDVVSASEIKNRSLAQAIEREKVLAYAR